MEKRSKKTIIIGITCLFLVMILLLGLTYAYFRTRIIGNDSNETSINVVSKKMEIVYEDGTAEMNMTGKIEPGFTASKTFYVKNTGNETVNYSVILDEMTNEFMRNQDWQVTLTKNGEKVISESDNKYLAVGTHQVLLGSESITASDTETATTDIYVLSITYKNLTDENQSEDMGMDLSFKVNIREEQYTWNDAPEDSLLYALKANQPSGDNALIVTSEDDYGVSYVYRGNITNNYVNYSGMCWRVVRVQGDGTIKVVLADENGECDADTYSVDNNSTAFINGAEIYDLSWYQGYYGDSGAVDEINEWANSKINVESLVEAEWCSDMAITNDLSDWCYENYGEEGECYVFAADDRLSLSNSLHSPSLKCNYKGLAESKSLRYSNYFGMLTADEVQIALDSKNSYLATNATLNPYFTLTPSSNAYSDISVFGVYGGSLKDVGSFGENFNIRPSVVLKNDVFTTYDVNSEYAPGTYQNPYKIIM